MGFYRRYLLPYLIHLAMRSRAAMAERARWVPLATGSVVEVGIGSGLNVPFYGTGVGALYGLDPSPQLLEMARGRATRAPFPVTLAEGSAEAIPLGDAVADTVVMTWTLCSIADPVRALKEIKRILKPHGHLLFVEHGWSPDAGVHRWQERLTPVWRRIGGGCHLNRKIDTLLAECGFQIGHLSRGYTTGPRPFAYLYRGVARRADC